VHYPLMRRHGTPYLTTAHGRQDVRDLRALYRAFPDAPLVSISDAQRRPLPGANWVATVYHGLPRDLLAPGPGAAGYLAFLGRVSPEKRLDRAIEIARRAGLPLKVAAKVDARDRPYFDAEIAPLLRRSPHVELVGEICDGEKGPFLGEALALLFPIDWPEPFGLVMTEAMACGTPTIAWPSGAVPEVIDEGLTGFVVDSIEGAVAAVERARAFDRRACRAAFEARFSAERMAADYLDVFQALQPGAEQPQVALPDAEAPAGADVDRDARRTRAAS